MAPPFMLDKPVLSNVHPCPSTKVSPFSPDRTVRGQVVEVVAFWHASREAGPSL
jgi:hypothetical protein